MAWLAVEKDGTEYIYSVKPERSTYCWLLPIDKHIIMAMMIEIPKGSIKKLIGKDLDWESDPVYINK